MRWSATARLTTTVSSTHCPPSPPSRSANFSRRSFSACCWSAARLARRWSKICAHGNIPASAPTRAGDRAGLERLLRYIVRCLFSIGGVIRLGDNEHVIYRAEHDNPRRFPLPAAGLGGCKPPLFGSRWIYTTTRLPVIADLPSASVSFRPLRELAAVRRFFGALPSTTSTAWRSSAT
jgi:hypothetical protein